MYSRLKRNNQESHSFATRKITEKTIKRIENDQILNTWEHCFKTLNDEN